MVRWMCSVKLAHHTPTNSLLQSLQVSWTFPIAYVCADSGGTGGTGMYRWYGHVQVVRACTGGTGMYRWYGHVQHSTSCINKVTGLVIPGDRGRGRPRKTWSECVRKDLLAHNLSDVNPLDREIWRTRIRQSLVLPTPEPGTPAAP